MIPFAWEEVNNTSTASTARAKVPGGWLVNVILNGRTTMMSTTFVADPEWSWEIGNEQPT
jgi:hypothetical protein